MRTYRFKNDEDSGMKGFKIHLFLWGAFLLLGMVSAPAASDTPIPYKELGLKTEGGPWRFYPANNPYPSLPKVLLIGDSITNHYRMNVAQHLQGKATVDSWVTAANLANPDLHDDLTKVIQQELYDVIHFNIGLHGWAEGDIPEGQYKPLLVSYVKVIKKQAPGALLIWGSTTTYLKFDLVKN